MYTMNSLVFLLATTGLGLAAGVPATQAGGGGRGRGGGHHHRGAGGHDENCVDISRYSKVKYNASLVEICSYSVAQKCEKRRKEVCAQVPVSTCRLVPAPNCSKVPMGQETMRNDQMAQQLFTPKECHEAGTQTIHGQEERPVCKMVTKPQHCESKWIVNDEGEKVWDGDENCVTATVEECSLETVEVPIQVPLYTCTDGAPLTYSVPVVATEAVTVFATHCEAAAKPVCANTATKEECIQVEYEECVDQLVPQCQVGPGHGEGQAVLPDFRIPYQTFDHRLKCLV